MCIAIQKKKKKKQLFKPFKSQYNTSMQYNFSTAHLYIAIQFSSLTTHPSCHTIRVLQYNGSTTNLPIAIQFPFSCNTIFCHCTPYIAIQSPIAIQFSCNTIFWPTCCSLSQYNFCIVTLSPAAILPLVIQTQGCNTFFFFTIQLGISPIPFCTYFFSFLPAAGKCPKKYIYTHFFSHTCYWKNTQKHKYTFFFIF